MSALIVITRPEPDASDYAKELQDLGYDVLIEPMLEMKALPFKDPDFSQYDGILATSANAIRFFGQGSGKPGNIPVYCVGKHTAAIARDFGFSDVISVNGTGIDLYTHILSLPDVNAKNLLHICGRYVAFPLAKKLNEHNLSVKILEVYDSLLVHQFSKEFIDALNAKKINAITFFSKRTSEAFVKNVQLHQCENLFSGIKALSISEAVLNYVRILPWQQSYASKSPDREGMLQIIDMCVSHDN